MQMENVTSLETKVGRQYDWPYTKIALTIYGGGRILGLSTFGSGTRSCLENERKWFEHVKHYLFDTANYPFICKSSIFIYIDYWHKCLLTSFQRQNLNYTTLWDMLIPCHWDNWQFHLDHLWSPQPKMFCINIIQNHNW